MLKKYLSALTLGMALNSLMTSPDYLGLIGLLVGVYVIKHV